MHTHRARDILLAHERESRTPLLGLIYTILKARRDEMLQKFQQRENLKKKKMERERRNGKRKRCAKTYLFFPFLIGLNKKKKQSQRYF